LLLKAGRIMIGVTAFGGYIPRLRLSRKAVVEANAWANAALAALGRGERSMCNWDEDSLTMGVEAARDCLTGFPRAAVKALYFASTTFPFADRPSSGIAAEALNLEVALDTLDLAASQRAGTSGLIAAFKAAGAGPLLFIAAEKRRARAASAQELLWGDGAAALLLGGEDPVAEYLGSYSEAVDFVDHYRGQYREFDYQWEERWIRDEGYAKIVPPVLDGLFHKTGVEPAEVAHFAFPCTYARLPQAIAKKTGIPEGSVRDNLQAVCGETGAAHPLVMLVDALQDAKPGELILLAAFGQGCDALLFRATASLPRLPARGGVRGPLARRKLETNYNKYLAFNDLMTIERGMRAEVDKQTALSTLYRKKDMLLGLVGGRCERCGTVQFPKTNVCVNPNCNALHSQADHPFADIPAKVMSYTADRLTYTPDPPAHYGMVQFEGGGRIMMDFSDVDEGSLEVGTPMRMAFRVKEYDPQRGFTKYFWKAVPA
jgi:3-hydroxy-3-methylglutaryl CoA synthase